MNYKNNSNYHRAAVYLDEAMKWAQQIEDETYRLAMIMSLHYEYSRMYLSTEKYYKGLSSMQQSMEACEKLYQKDPLAYQMTYARKCRDLGWSISYSNDYTEAVKYINRSLLILDSVEPMFPTKINHSKSIAYSYLGHIYFAMDDSKHSIENYEKALLYASKAYNNDPEGVIQTLFDVESNLGAHYCSNGNTDRGLELIQKSAIHLQVLYDADPSTYKQEFLKIHIILLYIYLQSGMTEEMMAEYLMLKEVDPDNSTVKQIEEYISSQR